MHLLKRLAAAAATSVVVLAFSGCASVSMPPAGTPADATAPMASPAPTATASAAVPAPGAGSPNDGSQPARATVGTAGRDASPSAPITAATASGGPAATAGQSASGRDPLSARQAYPDLWTRIRAGFAMPELNTPLVAQKEQFYVAKPEYLQRMFERGGRYLYFIVEELEKRGMPTELALLPFVESAMNPVALSSAQAAGLWQFIPSTGKQYELSQDWWVDNRRDPVQSTRAALDYLQKIYEMNERDWFLALASYNWGENAVARAVQRNRAKGLPIDYLSLPMPAETRHYVPKLIALKHIIERPASFGVALPALPNTAYFATIEKTRPIDLKLAAQFAGMTVEEFVALNPAHNRPVISASRNNQIKLPADRVDGFQAAVERHDQANKPLASWQPYTLKPGETIDDVARRGQVSSAELLRANGLKPNAQILAGTQLLAPHAQVKDQMQVESFAGARVYEQVSTPAVYHVLKKRDTLASVAASYGVPPAQLKAWNGAQKSLKPGTTVLVRPASSQTVLTTETGSRQVLARADRPLAAAPERQPVADAPETIKTVYRPGGATAQPAVAPAAPPVRAATKKPSPKAAPAKPAPAVRTVAAKPASKPARTSAPAGKPPRT